MGTGQGNKMKVFFLVKQGTVQKTDTNDIDITFYTVLNLTV